MKRVRHYHNNFTKGELDPSMWGHGQQSWYYESLACANNVWVTSCGSVAKRYGMARVRNYGGTKYVKLLTFSNVSGSHFLLIIYAGKVDILNAGTGEFITSINSPTFQIGLIPDLYGCPYQDSVIFTHHDIPPLHLKWKFGNTFQLTEIQFTNIPTFEFSVNDNSPNATLTASGISGFIQLTSSVGVFQISDVGKYVSILPVGRLRISTVISTTVVSGYLEESLFDTSAIPAGNWTLERGWEPLWGSGNGYPAVCGFHEGRLVFGNFVRASTVFAYSVVDSPFDFTIGDGSAAYGGWRILSYDQRNAIYHIFSEHSLYFFCGAGEFIVDQSNGESLNRAIIRHDTARGTISRVRPLVSEDGGIYFFQPGSTTLSEFRYFFDRGSHNANTISKYAGHLINFPCSAALWKGDETFETNILFFINSDGTMVSCTLNLNDRILAFTKTTSDWEFSNICCAGDNVFVTVLDGDGISIMRFISGNYQDAGHSYESSITLLPLSNEESSYCSSKISITSVYVYISETSCVKIGQNIIYNGQPATKKLTQYFPSGWESDGKVTLSDAAGSSHWQINNVCRNCLVGGVL